MTNPNDSISLESWRPIAGFEGKYDISNRGRVRSWYRGNRLLREPRIKKPSVSRFGYHMVVLGNSRGLFKGITVHRLVLTTFVQPQPSSIDACHLNGDKSDNRLENLVWGTRKENEAHKRIHGTVPSGERNGQSVLNIMQVRVIRRLKGRIPQRILGPMFGVSQSNISAVQLGVSWNALNAEAKP